MCKMKIKLFEVSLMHNKMNTVYRVQESLPLFTNASKVNNLMMIYMYYTPILVPRFVRCVPPSNDWLVWYNCKATNTRGYVPVILAMTYS